MPDDSNAEMIGKRVGLDDSPVFLNRAVTPLGIPNQAKIRGFVKHPGKNRSWKRLSIGLDIFDCSRAEVSETFAELAAFPVHPG